MNIPKKDANISTHVLDTARGLPAGQLRIELYVNSNTDEYTGEGDLTWEKVDEMHTDNDGRARFAFDLQPGIYKMVFYTFSFF